MQVIDRVVLPAATDQRDAAEAGDAGFAFHLVQLVEAALDVFGDEGDEQAQEQAEHQTDDGEQLAVGESGERRFDGFGDDPGIRAGQFGLSAGFLHALKEVLVQLAGGVGFALELADLDFDLGAVGVIGLKLTHPALQALLAGAGDRDIGVQGLDGALDLVLDARLDRGQFAAHADDGRMAVAVTGSTCRPACA